MQEPYERKGTNVHQRSQISGEGRSPERHLLCLVIRELHADGWLAGEKHRSNGSRRQKKED